MNQANLENLSFAQKYDTFENQTFSCTSPHGRGNFINAKTSANKGL